MFLKVHTEKYSTNAAGMSNKKSELLIEPHIIRDFPTVGDQANYVSE
jgi:hypothetical protein